MEKCICCGTVIPEGRQVCPECEALQDITENGINLGAGDYVALDSLKAAAKALEELTLYKQGKLCLVPADLYEKQCKELDELKESRWIPCSERLPEAQLTHDIFKRPTGYISDSVLVTVKSKEVDGTRYYVDTDIMTGSTLENVHWLMSCGYGGSAVYSQEIIAWRPLPEAYKPEMEEI